MRFKITILFLFLGLFASAQFHSPYYHASVVDSLILKHKGDTLFHIRLSHNKDTLFINNGYFVGGGGGIIDTTILATLWHLNHYFQPKGSYDSTWTDNGNNKQTSKRDSVSVKYIISNQQDGQNRGILMSDDMLEGFMLGYKGGGFGVTNPLSILSYVEPDSYGVHSMAYDYLDATYQRKGKLDILGNNGSSISQAGKDYHNYSKITVDTNNIIIDAKAIVLPKLKVRTGLDTIIVMIHDSLYKELLPVITPVDSIPWIHNATEKHTYPRYPSDSLMLPYSNFFPNSGGALFSRHNSNQYGELILSANAGLGVFGSYYGGNQSTITEWCNPSIHNIVFEVQSNSGTGQYAVEYNSFYPNSNASLGTSSSPWDRLFADTAIRFRGLPSIKKSKQLYIDPSTGYLSIGDTVHGSTIDTSLLKHKADSVAKSGYATQWDNAQKQNKLLTSLDTTKFLGSDLTMHSIWYADINHTPFSFNPVNGLWNGTGPYAMGSLAVNYLHGSTIWYNTFNYASPDSLLGLTSGTVCKLKWWLPLYAKDTNTHKNPITLDYFNAHNTGTTYTAGYGLGLSGTTFYNSRYWGLQDSLKTSLSGLVLATAGKLTAITNNSSNWDNGYAYRLTGATGSAPLTLGLSGNALTGSIDTSTAKTGLANLYQLGLKANKATTITINGTAYDLSANRSWTIPNYWQRVGPQVSPATANDNLQLVTSQNISADIENTSTGSGSNVAVDATVSGSNSGSNYAFYANSSGALHNYSLFGNSGLLWNNDSSYFGNYLRINPISAPSPVTDKLYNVGHSLYWNGSALGTGTGSVTNITMGYGLSSTQSPLTTTGTMKVDSTVLVSTVRFGHLTAYPTLNQSTTGSAGSVGHTLGNGYGITSLSFNGSATGTVTLDTSILWSNIKAGHLTSYPTLNQSTTGSAGSVTNALSNGYGINSLTYNGSSALSIVVDTSHIWSSVRAGHLTAYPTLNQSTTGSAGSVGHTLGNGYGITSLSFNGSATGTVITDTSVLWSTVRAGHLTAYPTLNQSTTGNAATATQVGHTLGNGYGITSLSFNGSATGTAIADTSVLVSTVRHGHITSYPTLNQSTTGQAGSVAGTLSNGYGINTLSFNGSGSTTVVADSSHLISTVRFSHLTAFPTLNQSTTGQAGSVANALTNGYGLNTFTYNGSGAISPVVDTTHIISTVRFGHLTAFPTLNQNTSGSSGSCTGNSVTATTATNITGGLGGSIPYQTAASTTTMLANGSAGQYLQSQGTTLAPKWATVTATVDTTTAGTGLVNKTRMSHLTAYPTLNQNTTGTANVAGGTVGAVPYQSAANTTGVVAATATAGLAFVSGANATPTWSTSPPLYKSTIRELFPPIFVDTSALISTGKVLIGYSGNITIDTLIYVLNRRAGTPSITPTIKYGTDWTASGTSVVTAPGAVTSYSTPTKVSGGTLNNITISAGNLIWMTWTETVAPKELYVIILGHYN